MPILKLNSFSLKWGGCKKPEKEIALVFVITTCKNLEIIIITVYRKLHFRKTSSTPEVEKQLPKVYEFKKAHTVVFCSPLR